MAVFSIGLRENSRVKMVMSGQNISTDTLLLAGIFDRVSVLLWAQSKDGQNGINIPISMVEQLTGGQRDKEKDEMVFNSGEEFDEYRKQLIQQIGGEV